MTWSLRGAVIEEYRENLNGNANLESRLDDFCHGVLQVYLNKDYIYFIIYDKIRMKK